MVPRLFLHRYRRQQRAGRPRLERLTPDRNSKSARNSCVDQVEIPQEIAIYAPALPGRLWQGEIVSGLKRHRLGLDTIFEEAPTLNYEVHPYTIVVSQDCDLVQDYTSRTGDGDISKQIPEILFCQAITAEELRGSGINSTVWNQVRKNKAERYHFFQKVLPDQDAFGSGLPELGVDFKRYFTIPTDEVYRRLEGEAKKRCRLMSPYLEHFSTRFAYYQFRVALPLDHISE